MKSPERLLIAVPLLLVGTLVAPLASHAAPSPRIDELFKETVWIETTVDSDRDGAKDRISVDIVRPSAGGKVPAVIRMSPYVDGLDESAQNHNVVMDRLPQEGRRVGEQGWAGLTQRRPELQQTVDWARNGYAFLTARSIGSSNSQGCPTSGDQQEALGAKAVIDWLNGRAPGFDSGGKAVLASWATGNAGMIGVSYEGTLPIMAAATGVEGLKAIIPVAAISNWYNYYRANGLVVAPGGYQGEDADVLARAVLGKQNKRCENILRQLGVDQDRSTGDMNAFWKARNYLGMASAVKAATFIVHGQNDWNVKESNATQWYEALRNTGVPLRMWLHRGGHDFAGRSDEGAQYLAWFDKFVKGVNNDVQSKPAVEVQDVDGTWRTMPSWPHPGTAPTTFYLSGGALETTAPTGGASTTLTDAGRDKRVVDLVANPSESKPGRTAFLTAAVTQDVVLSGTTQVTLGLSVNRPAANLTVALVEYTAQGKARIVTRGWADPQNRQGQERGEPLQPGQKVTVSFPLEPKDYVLKSGSRLGVVVMGTDDEFTLRIKGGTELRIDPSSTVTVMAGVVK